MTRQQSQFSPSSFSHKQPGWEMWHSRLWIVMRGGKGSFGTVWHVCDSGNIELVYTPAISRRTQCSRKTQNNSFLLVHLKWQCSSFFNHLACAVPLPWRWIIHRLLVKFFFMQRTLRWKSEVTIKEHLLRHTCIYCRRAASSLHYTACSRTLRWMHTQ